MPERRPGSARERLVCRCTVVSEREVILAVRRGARDVEGVAAACDAGTGCGGCRGAVERIVAEELARRARRAPSGRDDPAQVGLFGVRTDD
jgi:bacterioferritin-associated ferredoxin